VIPPHRVQPSTLSIGALAHAAGVGVETIRFYERKDLIPEPPRTQAGYRQYPSDTVDRVKFVRRAQRLGFALREISELLELRLDEVAACGPVEAQAREKLEQVVGKMEALQLIKTALQNLVEACKAREPTGACPILEKLDQADWPDD
jgi:MerR family mercuric resistance operon transcriptional regulator